MLGTGEEVVVCCMDAILGTLEEVLVVCIDGKLGTVAKVVVERNDDTLGTVEEIAVGCMDVEEVVVGPVDGLLGNSDLTVGGFFARSVTSE